MRIGARPFSHGDQERFAEYSLDRNPMHMDAVAARRLITGRQVVHGIHVLLHALELWCDDARRMPASIDCTFANPISVDDEVVYTQSAREDGAIALEASVNGLSCARILIGLAAASQPARAVAATQPLEPRREA